jgi:hypothetical protein
MKLGNGRYIADESEHSKVIKEDPFSPSVECCSLVRMNTIFLEFVILSINSNLNHLVHNRTMLIS